MHKFLFYYILNEWSDWLNDQETCAQVIITVPGIIIKSVKYPEYTMKVLPTKKKVTFG